MRPLDPPSSLPEKHGGDFLTSNVFLTNSHSAVGGKRRAIAWARPSLRRKPTPKTSVAVFAVILIAVALTSLCMRLRTSVRGAENSGRRLAGSEEGEGSQDDELGGILDQCLDMEQEYYGTSGSNVLSVPDPPAVLTSQPAVLSPGQTASMAGPMHGASHRAPSHFVKPTLLGGFALPYDVPSKSGLPTPSFDSLSPEAWLESIPFISLSEVASHGEAAPVAGTVSMAVPGHEVSQTAVAHPLGPAAEDEGAAPLTASSDGSLSGPSSGGLPTLSSDSLTSLAWLINIPHSLSQEVGLQGEAPVMKQALQEDEQPSSSAAASAELARSASGADQGWGLLEHPFVRLPVAPPGVSLRLMDPDLKASTYFRHASTSQLFEVLRGLLAKWELTSEDALMLLDIAESLVRHTRLRLGPVSYIRNAHLARHLGIFFMTVDAVVSIAAILGQDPTAYPWWPSFVASFPTEYSLKEPRRLGNEKSHINYLLLKRLTASLEIYKSGHRPHPRDVLELKRMLLCSPSSLTYFKAPRWDPWRQDDKNFGKPQVESSDDSKEEDEED